MHFYHSSTDAWLAMTQACARAEKSIDFEEYIIRDDSVGIKLLTIFMAKARDGVRVRLLFDAFGSRQLRQSQLITELYDAGVQLVFYRPMNFVQDTLPILSLPRNHAKVLHIDGTVSYIGSMCVAAHMIGWRDTLLALEGHVATRSQLDFNRVWSREALNITYRPSVDILEDEPEADTYAAQIPELDIASIIDILVARIATAKTSVLIATPYFYPPRKLRETLITAQTRGISIILMLASQTDILLADTVTRGLISYWRRLGFDVVFYQPTVLHAKYAIIDNDWATVGSCNFDLLSSKHNREANVVLRNPLHVQKLISQSKVDLSNCLPLPATRSVHNMWNKALGKLGALVYRVF